MWVISKFLSEMFVRNCSQQVRRQLFNEIKQSRSASNVPNVLQNKIIQIERFSLKKTVYNIRKYHRYVLIK